MSRIRKTALGRSIFRHGWDDTTRNRMIAVFDNFFIHIHPTRVRRSALDYTFTWGLGGITFLCFFVTIVSGVMLGAWYVPSTELAYGSVQDLHYNIVPFGRLVRTLHRWAGHGMVVAAILHMIRVFLTGSYKRPREFNWVVGLVLLGLLVATSFTGYLLVWDQVGYWSVAMGMNMLSHAPLVGAQGPLRLPFITVDNDLAYTLMGSRVPDDRTLRRFYALHVFGLPMFLGLLTSIHFWRVRKDGFSAPSAVGSLSPTGPKSIDENAVQGIVEEVPTWPNLVAREALAVLVVVFIARMWATLQPAPLALMADPSRTPNPLKAPWFLVGFQELAVYFDPWLAELAFPAILFLGLLALPYIDPNPRGIGIYGFSHRAAAISLFMIGYLLWLVLTLIGVFFRGPYWELVSPLTGAVWMTAEQSLGSWSMPTILGLAFLVVWYAGGIIFPRKRAPQVFVEQRPFAYTFLMIVVMTGLLIPLKIVLRLVLGLQYFLVTPWFNL